MNRPLTRRGSIEVQPIDRFFARMFEDPFFAVRTAPLGAAAVDEGSLALDISEDNDNVIVRASLPGFARENIEVEVHDGVLTIKAEHTEESEESGEQYYRKERRFGSVSRRVALPSPVNEDGAKAELKDGVLTLRFPRAVKSTGRKVQIN
ncbi:MAG: Hsp20/alpha crystallin family protein [Phycisphaerales bacterium]|nr:Hsp20/alpha crystallin family protein [Phycisphaerales bacterium]